MGVFKENKNQDNKVGNALKIGWSTQASLRP